MSKRQRRPRRNRHFRIDEEIRAADREAYLAYLREPRTTNKSAHAWLVARGYTQFSESAVARHMRHALEGFEEQREAHRFALRLAEMSGGDLSSETFLRGAILRVDQLILLATFELPPDVEGSTAEDVGEFADAMERLIDLRKKLGELEAALGGRVDPALDEREASERVREIVNAIPGRN